MVTRRTRPCGVLVLGLSLAAWSLPAEAALCHVDSVPAATLLLPYFEVDLENPGSRTTLFSINNVAAGAVLAHVTLWTDWAVPTLRFDVYLTGYDVQTINVRDLFVGNLPRTAPLDQDPGDTISNRGLISQDTSWPGCTALPYGLPALTPDQAVQLRLAHSGGNSAAWGGCASENWEDGHPRGYITVDVARQCSDLSPADVGYFDTVAGDANVLWGRYFQVDSANNYAQGEALVAIEACPPVVAGALDTCPFGFGDYTFYGRYVNGDARDRREPLATSFATSFLNGGLFSGGTELTVWRDTKRPPVGQDGAHSCVPFRRPGWWPLLEADVVAFDEEENLEDLCGFGGQVIPVLPQGCFRVATQQLPLAGDLLSTSAPFGWMYLNLNHIAEAPSTLFPGRQQAWVVASMSAEGRFSAGFDASALDSACAPGPQGGVVLVP